MGYLLSSYSICVFLGTIEFLHYMMSSFEVLIEIIDKSFNLKIENAAKEVSEYNQRNGEGVKLSRP